MISVLVANVNEFYRAGIRTIIAETAGMRVAGEAGNGNGAARWCRDRHADVVLMDLEFPSMNGLEAARRITCCSQETRVILLTDESELVSPYKVLSSGVAGYLFQNCLREDLLHAIRVISCGQRYVAPVIAQQTILDARLHVHDTNPLDKLSSQERQVMVMIARGIRPAQIAEKMFLSTKTVNSYRYRIFKKLNIEGDIKLTHMALRYGLVHIDRVVYDNTAAGNIPGSNTSVSPVSGGNTYSAVATEIRRE